jgi:hypothetical protein
MTDKLGLDHVNILVEMLAEHALDPTLTSQEYFNDLIASSALPPRWKGEITGQLRGRPMIEARKLVNWAIMRGVNPNDQRYTALGALLHSLLQQELSPDEARKVVAILVGYGLIRDKALLDDIMVRYAVPGLASTPPSAGVDYGPPFTWRGPTSDLELQSFFSPAIPWQDVGFLMRAIERTSSVCRVEVDSIRGTGFLVAPGLVLTNFHVLQPTPNDDIEANARKAVLRFGCFTAVGGNPDQGQTFRLAPGFIVERSSVGDLDFVLLQVDSKIQAEGAIKPAPLESESPYPKSALNIIHHPGGDTMKLSTSGNGVSGN